MQSELNLQSGIPMLGVYMIDQLLLVLIASGASFGRDTGCSYQAIALITSLLMMLTPCRGTCNTCKMQFC